MRKLRLTAAMIGLIVAAPAAQSADPKWHIRQGAIICPNYFSIRDGQAAAERGDVKWLNEVGCNVAAEPLKITILESPPRDPISGISRVRLHRSDGNDVTVYTSTLNVMGRADNGAGPMRYIDVFNKNNELNDLKTPKRPKESTRDFGELMNKLNDVPPKAPFAK